MNNLGEIPFITLDRRKVLDNFTTVYLSKKLSSLIRPKAKGLRACMVIHSEDSFSIAFVNPSNSDFRDKYKMSDGGKRGTKSQDYGSTVFHHKNRRGDFDLLMGLYEVDEEYYLNGIDYISFEKSESDTFQDLVNKKKLQ